MDTLAAVTEYNAMDHSVVNQLFAQEFLAFAKEQYLGDLDADVWTVLDVGTGTPGPRKRLVCWRSAALRDRSLLSRERKATMAFFGRKWTMINANVSSGFHSCPLVLIRGSSCMP